MVLIASQYRDVSISPTNISSSIARSPTMESASANQFILNENGEEPTTAQTSSSQLQKIRRMGKDEVTKWFLRFILKRYGPTFATLLDPLQAYEVKAATQSSSSSLGACAVGSRSCLSPSLEFRDTLGRASILVSKTLRFSSSPDTSP